MANFKTHVSFSSAAGIAYGTGIWLLGVPAPTSAIAGGLCAMAGMLPDVDCKTSRALQETLYILAGLVCMFVLARLRDSELNGDLIFVVGAAAFVLTKYVVGMFTMHATSHRGMIHSIPMALIAGEIAYLLSTGSHTFRAIKALGLIIGFMSHLLLDEIYSVDVRGVRLKKSFGTALKFVSLEKPQKTFFTYLLLFVFGYLILSEERWIGKFTDRTSQFTSAGVKALEKYSSKVYSDNPMDEAWEQEYLWFLAASNYYPSTYANQEQQDYSEDYYANHYPEEDVNAVYPPEDLPPVVRRSFSREPVSREAFVRDSSGTTTNSSSLAKPYQPPSDSRRLLNWGSVPNSSQTPGTASSIFKSRPQSPTGID